MTAYLKFKVKSMLKDPEYIGWSIIFIEFWVAMWVFVFSPARMSVGAANANIAMAYSFLGVLSMAAAAIGVAFQSLYTSRAARFLARFSKLTFTRLVIEDFLSSILALVISAAVILLSVLGVAYARWGIVASVENPAGLFVDLLAGGVLLYWLSYALAQALIVARRTRSLSMVSFVPLILGFLSYAQLWVDMGWAAYVIPVCSIPPLMIYHSLGVQPPRGAFLKWLYSPEALPPSDLRLAAFSTAAWIAVLAVVSLFLTRRGQGVPLEEIRL